MEYNNYYDSVKKGVTNCENWGLKCRKRKENKRFWDIQNGHIMVANGKGMKAVGSDEILWMD